MSISYKDLQKIVEHQKEDSKHDRGSHSVDRALDGVLEKIKDVTSGADDERITIEKVGNTTRIVIDDLAKCAVLLNDSTAKELYYKIGETFNLG